MASEEPLFDPSLKKRKKKTVAFTEDPLGPEADPTTPAPATIESTTANGDAVDLGPATVHEQMKRNQTGEDGDADGDDQKQDDEFKSMFPDGLKKKKKKKDIPMDFVWRAVRVTCACLIFQIRARRDLAHQRQQAAPPPRSPPKTSTSQI